MRCDPFRLPERLVGLEVAMVRTRGEPTFCCGLYDRSQCAESWICKSPRFYLRSAIFFVSAVAPCGLRFPQRFGVRT